MKKTDKRSFFAALLIGIIVMLFLNTMMLNQYQGNIRMETYDFSESSKELKNPNRGFYNLYRFMITDEKVNYWQQISELYITDNDTSLTLLEINLQNYRDSEISEAGIANIEALFQALRDIDKQLIVRFVYDWDGENEKYEPESMDIILKHMEQLEGILREASRQIFVLQGLFIGNWGEMNGTKYNNNEELLCLAEQLGNMTEPSIYLAVRTPSQWRGITGLQDASEETLKKHPLAGRISLYNDGMLGNISDYGTYKIQDAAGKENAGREKELAFQKQLCSRVPNGGEVINDNYYNDFKNAIQDLATMHVTYLNKGHDQTVLEKWKKAEITGEGCYKGMDGYTYIERHLGYRLLIKKAEFNSNSFMDYIEVNVTMKNVGFAPIYTESESALIFYDEEQDKCLSYELAGDLRELTGGDDAGKSLILKTRISKSELSEGEYKVFFLLTDLSTGRPVFLANEQDMEEYGYNIGVVELKE